jgi:hypothetical protein
MASVLSDRREDLARLDQRALIGVPARELSVRSIASSACFGTA